MKWIKDISNYIFSCIALALLFSTAFGQEVDGDKVIDIRSRNNTVFSLFSEISRQTGFYFIYDSELIDNEKRLAISRGEYKLSEILEMITNEFPEIDIRFIESYVILHPKSDLAKDTIPAKDPLEKSEDAPSHVVINGRVIDSSSGEVLPFASIVLKGRGKGISTNANGVFSFKAPLDALNDTLKISYMGYISRLIPVNLLYTTTSDIYMDVESRYLEEVVIRSFNPLTILIEAIVAIPDLYPQEPTLHTSFYREGVFRNDDLLTYTEAVFDVYKTPYRGMAADQVKLLKSRKIINLDDHDTLMIKLKAGVRSMLDLDIVKIPPEFLMPEYLGNLKFPSTGFVAHSEGVAYVIAFENADYVQNGIYEGTIYIDTQTYAIIQVDFNITPDYLQRNQHLFITRRSRLHNTRIRSMEYSVRYAYHDGNYHVQHVRGEIAMRIRERNRWVGSNYKAFFEMAVMNIETEDVKRFSRRETIRPNVIFSDQQFVYDIDFWEDFNFVMPELEITRALKNFNVGIEGFDPDY